MRNMLSRMRGAVKSFLYTGPARDRWQQPESVLSALDLKPGQRVADLGAGGGYLTFRLARAVGPEGRVYAVDTDHDMRYRVDRQAADKGLANINTVDPTEGPLAPEQLDLVLIVNTFHHLPEDVTYFEDLADLLADGGRLAVIEPHPRWFLFGHATEGDSIRSTLTAAGFSEDADLDFLSRQSFLVFRPARA